MGYSKAQDVLPKELLLLVQEYVDGRLLYIPRKTCARSAWGSVSGAKEFLQRRNAQIAADFRGGVGVKELAQTYFLSEKSIQRILRECEPSQSAPDGARQEENP